MGWILGRKKVFCFSLAKEQGLVKISQPQIGLHPFAYLGPFFYLLPMDVTISPTEMHDFSAIYGATLLAVAAVAEKEFTVKETAYIAGVSLLAGSLSEEDMLPFCRCLYSLVERRIFLGEGDTRHPLPPYDPSLEKDPLFFAGIDVFIGCYSYYLYSIKKVDAPEQAIRPITFLLYEAFEGLEEGLGLSSPELKGIYQGKLESFQNADSIVKTWKEHLDMIGELI